MKRFFLVMLFVAAAVAVALGFGSFPFSEVTSYRSIRVEKDEFVIAVGATGTVQPEEIVDVGAQVVGRIQSFGADPSDDTKTIDYGTLVEEGGVLARLDDSTFQALVKQARANLNRALAEQKRFAARARQAQADWRRVEDAGDAISDSDRDRYKAELDITKAEVELGAASVEQAEASLEQAESNLSHTTIRSPINGVVIDRRVNVGQTVVAGLNAPSLFLLAKDLKRLRVWASVNEADIGSISVGQPVTFTVDAFRDRTFHGEVTQIRLDASMTNNVVTYTIIVTTDNTDESLLPYMTAKLRFQIERHEDALLVPNQALRWRPKPADLSPESKAKLRQLGYRPKGKQQRTAVIDGPALVWVLAEDGTLRPVELVIGQSNGVRTRVIEGDLRVGDQVVVGTAVSNQADNRVPFLPRRRNNVNRGGEANDI